MRTPGCEEEVGSGSLRIFGGSGGAAPCVGTEVAADRGIPHGCRPLPADTRLAGRERAGRGGDLPNPGSPDGKASWRPPLGGPCSRGCSGVGTCAYCSCFGVPAGVAGGTRGGRCAVDTAGKRQSRSESNTGRGRITPCITVSFHVDGRPARLGRVPQWPCPSTESSADVRAMSVAQFIYPPTRDRWTMFVASRC